ncbi:hypothetical protein DFH09DRAFT_1073080 [Mycena vulgaris]|nr:hypothetical protein DFH09DRAFT_1073080 [Mycena vulgaris]
MALPKVTSLYAKLGIPSFRDDIARWNSAREAHFESPVGSILSDLDRLMPGLKLANPLNGDIDPGVRESYMAGSRDRIRCLSSMQTDLGVLAVTSILQPDFCWKKLTRAAREAHILEGFFRTCLHDTQEIPACRIYTSDITLASLEKKSGTGFLNLLKKYVRASGVSVEDAAWVLYPHPKWRTEKLQQLRETGNNDEV